VCQENTNANAAVSSPVSLEEETTEPKQEPVYGSLATVKPISKSEQVSSVFTKIHTHAYLLYVLDCSIKRL
jgi:hypothetical protein